MIEIFNSIFFALTVLFGVEASIYSEYTEMKVDLNKNTVLDMIGTTREFP